MVIGKIDNDRDEHRECLVLVGLKDVEEVVVFEEAHSAICDLKMDTSDAANNPLEESWDEMFDLINFTNFKDFLQFCQEEGLFNAISKRPVFQ